MMATWRMRIVYWISNAKNTHEYFKVLLSISSNIFTLFHVKLPLLSVRADATNYNAQRNLTILCDIVFYVHNCTIGKINVILCKVFIMCYNIFSNYLTNGTIFGKQLLNTKCVF
jgi:hypothetical protein